MRCPLVADGDFQQVQSLSLTLPGIEVRLSTQKLRSEPHTVSDFQRAACAGFELPRLARSHAALQKFQFVRYTPGTPAASARMRRFESLGSTAGSEAAQQSCTLIL